MTNPLADIDNIGFFDTETRAEPHVSVSDSNVKTAGTYRYAKSSFVIISTFGIGDAPVFDVSLDRGFDRDWLLWSEMPVALREFYKRVEQREAWFAAWNAGFDKAAWQNGTADWPPLEADMIIDVMAQATSSGLPPKLEQASRAIGRDGKHPDGSRLINKFCARDGALIWLPDGSVDPDWETFKLYGRMDTDEMREIWKSTRALPFEEWEDYWVSETINERGQPIDLHMVERAAKIASASTARINAELTRWTNGKITAVTQVQRIAEWAYDRIENAEARMLMVSEWDEDASTEDGEEADLKVGKLSLARDRIEKVLLFFEAKKERDGELSGGDQTLVDVLTARQYGGSSSPAKFAKALAQHDNGLLKGSYVFNGAPQTGRFSSKGLQVHNLTRSSLEEFEVEAINMINDLEI